MLKALNSPIMRSIPERTRRTEISDSDDNMLERVFLFRGEFVMLTCNLWVQTSLVNVILGYIENIFFAPSSKFPQLP